MKIKLIFYFLILVLFSNAQKVEVLSIKKINDASEHKFFYPKVSPKSNYLLLSTFDYTGLTKYSIGSEELQVINNDAGAGYNASISNDESKVLYNAVKFKDRRRYNSLVEQDINKKDKRVLEQFTRNPIKSCLINSKPVYVMNGKMKKNKALKSANVKQLILNIENRNLVLYDNGIRKVINPNGNGKSYIWPSISPDKKHIVYTLVGRGTYVANIDGSNAQFLGELNAPKWLGNKYIIGMNDIDDGEVLLSSDIVVSSINGKVREVLPTPEGVKAMYPSSSVDGGTVAFNSEIGEVYLMKLKIK